MADATMAPGDDGRAAARLTTTTTTTTTTTKATTTTMAYRKSQPEVELVLSRSAYRAGGTVVGTVRLILRGMMMMGGEARAQARATSLRGLDEGGESPSPSPSLSPPSSSASSPTSSSSSSSASTSPQPLPSDDRTLSSRPAPSSSSLFPPGPPPRKVFDSALLYLAGRCRIDPRWHDSKSLARLYGTHPLLSPSSDLDPPDVDDVAVDAYFGERGDGVHVEGGTTVVFWATNVLRLLDLDERGEEGRWEALRPKKLRLSGSGGGSGDGDGDGDANEDADGCPGTNLSNLEEQQLTFSFRSDLPDDVPPSARAACARYFYSAVVCARTRGGRTIIVQAPFEVLARTLSSPLLSSPSSRLGGPGGVYNRRSAGRVKIGACSAVAHSNGLPCYLSSTDMIRPAKISVDRNRGILSFCGGGRGGAAASSSSSDVRTVLVADPGDGASLPPSPCCVLTALGTSVMRPGCRAVIRFDFDEETLLAASPKSQTAAMDGPPRDGRSGIGVGAVASPFLACRQVGASLQGEEVAIGADGTRKKTRSYIFDSAHSYVEPGYTDSVSLDLVMPLDCPCSLRTDIVEIEITCKIEITVDRRQRGKGGEDSGGYDVLRMELPCEVVRDAPDEDGGIYDGDGNSDGTASARAPGIMPWERSEHEKKAQGEFYSIDIMPDLKMLSLRMLDAMTAE